MVLSLPLPYDVEKHPKEAFFMSKDTETIKRDAEVAQFRFALIAPVIQGLFPDTSATAYYKRVTASPLTLPDGSIVSYSYKTLEKWKSQYKIGGLDALMPNTRSDKGFSRALNEEAIAEIYRIKLEHPRMNATQIYEHLVRESFIPANVSVDSVQRFIRRNDLKSAGIQICATGKLTRKMNLVKSGRRTPVTFLTSRRRAKADAFTAS